MARLFRWAVFAIVIVLILNGSTCGEQALSAKDPVREFLEGPSQVKYPDKGTQVRLLQNALIVLGYLNDEADGHFGPLTRAAVTAFQRQKGLRTDGIVGPATKGAMLVDYLRTNPPDTHTVKRGETLSSIGYLYGISVDYLQQANGLGNRDQIYAGQVLLLKAPQTYEEDTAQEDTAPEDYAVAEKDNSFPPPSSRVCLTFDDGPDPISTREILSTLDRYGVSATFFLVGERVDRYPEIAREIVERGHVVGVHGYEHKPLSGLSSSEVAKDLKWAKDAIVKATGSVPWLFRPPTGALDQTQVKEASRLGLRVLMWTNIGGADLGASSPQEVVERIVGGARDGGTLLLHEGLKHTVDALPDIIETLARMGYGFQNPAPPK